MLLCTWSATKDQRNKRLQMNHNIRRGVPAGSVGEKNNSPASMKYDKCALFICKKHAQKQTICSKCVKENAANQA